MLLSTPGFWLIQNDARISLVGYSCSTSGKTKYEDYIPSWVVLEKIYKLKGTTEEAVDGFCKIL